MTGFGVRARPAVLAARYDAPQLRRFLEDVGTVPMVGFSAAVVGAVERRVLHHQPGARRRRSVSAPTSETPDYFENAIHDYDAFDSKPTSASGQLGPAGLLSLFAATGTFEGFFRNDNGQSDPAITSLFDFPTNDPSYATLGREVGFRGDIRYLGTAGIGPLPNDRRHQGKVYGNYLFGFGVNLVSV